MNRRQALASALAALVAGMSLEGVATAGGMDPKSLDEASFPAFLEELDRLVERHRAAQTHPLMAEVLERWGLAPDHIQSAAACTLFLSAFRDLSPELQARPEMQERARLFVPRYGALVLAITLALRRLPGEELRRYSGLLRANPRLGPALRRQALRGMEERGVPRERREQYDALVSRLHFRLARQGPELLLAELDERVQRAAEAAGLEDGQWEAAVATGSTPPAVRREELPHPVARAIFRFGLITAGVGAAVFLISLRFGTGEVGTVVGGVVLLLGGLLLLIALVALIASPIPVQLGGAEPKLPEEALLIMEAAPPLASVPA